MGAGSVFGAVFVISWLRARFSPDSVTLSANLLIVLAYVLMAFVRQVELFFVVAALAGAGWTLSASELWVAAQRSIPSWARGRMNAAVIMISQGAMVFGGVIWSSAAAVAGLIHTLLGASVLFLMSLLLAGRLSINVGADLEERVPGLLSGSVESGEGMSIALAAHVYLLSMAAAYLNQTFTGWIPAPPVSKSPLLSGIEGKASQDHRTNREV